MFVWGWFLVWSCYVVVVYVEVKVSFVVSFMLVIRIGFFSNFSRRKMCCG